MTKQPIQGYRVLSENEIALINEIKAKAEEVGALCDRVKHTDGVAGRWAAIAITDLQQGFMALVRSVAQPSTF